MATLITKTADTSPTSDDITYVVNDPGGTPADRKVTLGNVVTKAHGLADGNLKISSGVMAVGTAAISEGGTGQTTAQAAIDALTQVSAATNEYVFTKDTATGSAKWKVLAGSGQTVVTRIVAASGGDYTTLGAALTAASSGDTIYVRKGTYTESAINIATTNLTIIGESRENSIVSMGANNITLSGANVVVQNLQITSSTGVHTYSGNTQSFFNNVIKTSTNTTATINFSGLDKVIIGNRFELTSASAGFRILYGTGDRSEWLDNLIVLSGESSTTAQGVVEIAGNYIKVNNNTFRCTAGTNKRPTLGFGKVSGTLMGTLIGNNIIAESNTGGIIIGSSSSYCTISGNNVYVTGAALDISGTEHCVTANHLSSQTNASGDYGVVVNGGTKHVITGNTLRGGGSSSTAAISLAASNTNCTISGNGIEGWATGISIASGCDTNNITGNNISASVTTPISDSGLNNDAYNNTGVPSINEKRHVYMKNTSGGTINAGNIVTFKSVAAGNEVTTTTTAGDDKVYGMATAAILNNASGYIQILGKTTLLTADGTTDIAVGDFLTTFTTAGIVAKAAAGDQCIAIALEAYTTNDSNGVLDALLIPPRMI